MRRIFFRLDYLKWLLPIVVLLVFFTPGFAHAEKKVVISAPSADLEVDKEIELTVAIDTDGQPVNAVGFTVNFPTENIEGLVPSHANSVFPFWVTESATRIDCGIQGQTGFNGTGLITTLRFKGRQAGEARVQLTNVKVLFAGISVGAFETNFIDLTVYGEGEAPAPPPEEEKPKRNIVPPSSSSTTAATPTPNDQVEAAIPSPTQTFGSLAQVKGTKGSSTEDVLKAAPVVEAEASVKGLFGKTSILWTSILPTTLLIIIIILLGIKLYFNEKKRHLNMERIFDKQLGTLAALESKIDIIEQSGEAGKERYIEELETAKKEIINEAGSDLRAGAKNVATPQPNQAVK